ncbi:unnamed protein product [Amoebophrya sp. A120]|nr:unnamed protein product [Amoebophrya sp. A120]|eukprot:GSA120T00012034001.1
MWYSARFWQDVTDTECRARWNAKLAREGRGAKCREPLQRAMIEETASADYNAHYVVPAKPKSNVHNCAGTLQNGYDTPRSFRDAPASEAGESTSSRQLFEITDGSLFFAPSCGYFRIGQMNPMNNNSSQFAMCCKNPSAQLYEGYDWRFGKRVKNRPASEMSRSVSDVDLLRSVRQIKKEALSAETVRYPKK